MSVYVSEYVPQLHAVFLTFGYAPDEMHFVFRMDIEAEMNRFEQALAFGKQEFLEKTQNDVVREVTVAVDSLATCCLGMPFITVRIPKVVCWRHYASAISHITLSQQFQSSPSSW